MIKQNIEYGLEGAFKVDIFDAKGKCVETGEWFNNFITQSGLLYPKDYSFAQCFRFLTIGSNSSNNDGGRPPSAGATSGCYTPFYTFTATSDNDVTTETQKGAWMGYEGYVTGVLGNSTCQTILESKGVRFYRAWSVPSGAEGTVVSASQPGGFLNIQEFSVSPSSGGDPKGCFAFSRVKRNLPIYAGYRAVISYQLFVQMKNYSVSPLSKNSFVTSNADTTNDADLVTMWGNVSGFYRQIWPGLNCIDYYGVTFTPKFGCGMEPSLTNLDKYFLYFSPDNGAFEVNAPSGGPALNMTGAWRSEGLMGILPSTLVFNAERTLPNTQDGMRNLFYGPISLSTSIPTQETLYNIRLGSPSNPLTTAYLPDYTKDVNIGSRYYNSQFNYQNGLINASVEKISHATAGTSGINDDRSVGSYSVDGNLQKAIFSTRMYRLPMNQRAAAVGEPANYNTWTGRRKNITRKAIFAPASSLGFNSRFSSMVFAYMASRTSEGEGVFYPVMDAMFYDSSGLAMLQHYRMISGIYLTERGTGVLKCSVGIYPQHPDNNIRKWASRRTFQGPVSGFVAVPGWVTNVTSGGGTWRRANLISGRNSMMVYLNGATPAFTGTSGNSSFSSGYLGEFCSGWGGVIGIQGDDYNNPSDVAYVPTYDMGVCPHPTGIVGNIEPTGTNPSSMYWPYFNTGPDGETNLPLHVDFYDIMFYRPRTLGDTAPMSNTWWTDNVAWTPTQLATTSGFCRPTGYIVHYDAIGPVGYRLLSHYGRAKLDTNLNPVYPPSIGGGYPAFSLDNGLEVYLDISWSSDCAGVDNCLPPPVE